MSQTTIHRAHSTQSTNQASCSVGFSHERRTRGLYLALGSLATAGTALFLVSQIPHTPGLRVDMAVLAVVGAIASIVLGIHAVGGLFGGMTVSSHGVRVRNGLEGFSFAWSDLRSWHSNRRSLSDIRPMLSFSIAGRPHPRVIPGGYLTFADFELVVRTIESHQRTSESAAVVQQDPLRHQSTSHRNGAKSKKSRV